MSKYSETPIITALPNSTGLRAWYYQDGDLFSTAIDAILVHDDGTLEPIELDSDGVSGCPDETSNFVAYTREDLTPDLRAEWIKVHEARQARRAQR